MSVHKKYDSLILELLLLSSLRKLGGECSVHQDVKNELEAFTRRMYGYVREKSINTLRGIYNSDKDGRRDDHLNDNQTRPDFHLA